MGWLTNYSISPADNSSGWVNFTLGLRVESAQLSNTGGSQIRVTITGGSGEGISLAAVYIGMAAASGDAYDFETTPTQVLFSGSSSVVAAAGVAVVSDAVTFSVEASKAVLLTTFADSAANDTSFQITAGQTGFAGFYKSANEPALVDKTAYVYPYVPVLFTKLESFFVDAILGPTYDTSAEVERTGTTDPQTWTHTPVGIPRGVAVAIVHGTSSTDHVVSVTYGGVALTRKIRATDTAGEDGAAEWWFLGSGIPTGAQTVSVDLSSGTTDDMHFVSVTVTANADTEVIDTDSLSGDQADPSVTLQYGGRYGLAVAALYGGGAAPTNFTPNANCTTMQDFDFGNFYSRTIRQTTTGTADFAIGGTATSDDVAYAAMAMAEIARSARQNVAVNQAVNRACRF